MGAWPAEVMGRAGADGRLGCRGDVTIAIGSAPGRLRPAEREVLFLVRASVWRTGGVVIAATVPFGFAGGVIGFLGAKNFRRCPACRHVFRV